MVSEKKKSEFRTLIQTWAENNLVDYPWRKNRTPYRVLISEILLTRTKAAQVVPVYDIFMETYPNLDAFMKMDFSKVKSIIKSLGLLFRAEMLKDISVKLKKNNNGKIPEDFSELKSLKGIGDYGVNAILCFGFGHKRPLLDSNFIRIYSRIFEVKPKTKTAKSDKFLWEFSEELLPEKNFVIFNYAVLDLGGLICLPRKPKCKFCPLRSICRHFFLKK